MEQKHVKPLHSVNRLYSSLNTHSEKGAIETHSGMRSGLLYTAHIHHSVTHEAHQHSVCSCKLYVGLRLNYETYSFYIAPCNCLQGAVAQYAANQNREHRGEPLLFSISALGPFSVRYKTHGTNGFTSHPKDGASWLSVRLKETGVTTGTRTHT